MRGVREPHKEQTGERRAIEEMRGGDRKINESGLAKPSKWATIQQSRPDKTMSI